MFQVFKGAIDITVYVALRDSTTGAAKTGIAHSDVTGSYTRMREARTTITMANLAAANSAHSDGGWEEINSTDCPGLYRFDIPDLAFASGADGVTVTVKATGAITEHLHIFLTSWNEQVAAIPNAVAAANGGLPTVDANNGVKLRDGTGAGEIDLASGKVLLQDNAITANAIHSTGSELIADEVWDELMAGHTAFGTYGQRLQAVWETVATASTSSTVTLNAGTQPDGFFNDHYVFVTGGTAVGQVRRITDWDLATKELTVTPNWTTGLEPDSGDDIIILPDRIEVAGGALTASDVWAFGTRTITGGTITTYTGNTPQTGDAYARLGAPAGASVSADIATRASQTSVDTIDDFLDTEIAALTTNLATANSNISTVLSDTNDIQTRLPAALVAGRMDTSVGAMATGVLTATAIGTDAITAGKIDTTAVNEIQSGLATSAAVTTLQSDVTTLGTNLGTANTNISTVLSRIGAFTGSGVNTILGFFKALARSDASNPSDLGGTYDAAAHSLEVIDGGGGGGGGSTAEDIWEYPTRTLTQSAATVAAVVAGGDVTVYRGDTLTIALTDVGSLASNSKVWFGVKALTDAALDAADTTAQLLVEKTVGLLYINGSAGTAGHASLTVDDAVSGDITVSVLPAASALLVPGRYRYDVQALISGAIITRASGYFTVRADVVRATS